jgi:uncharacterized protein (TIGR02147 family)
MDATELDPCEFLDYRDYLAELYRVRKAEKPWYSYKTFGDKAGMDASLLAKVLSKARHIADDSIGHFATACNLSDRFAEYFAAMVHFTKAKEDSEAREWFERMLSLRTNEARRLEGDGYAFYQRWYHTAIRAALDYFPYDGGNPEALGKHLLPLVAPEQVRESIETLEALGLISRDAQGFYRPTELGVTSGAGWKSVAVHTFQSETLRLALEGLDRIPKGLRNYSTLTMNLSAEDFEDVKERIRDFRQQLVKFIHSRSHGDRVYQMNVQLLPLTDCRGNV